MSSIDGAIYYTIVLDDETTVQQSPAVLFVRHIYIGTGVRRVPHFIQRRERQTGVPGKYVYAKYPRNESHRVGEEIEQ